MKNVSLILLAGVMTYSSQAFSLGGGLDYEGGLFWGADLNRNEQLDIHEAKSIYNLGDKNVFAKYDKSGEGVITRLEFHDYILKRSRDE